MGQLTVLGAALVQSAEPTPVPGVTEAPEPQPTVTVTVQPEPAAPEYGTAEGTLDLFIVFAVIVVALLAYIAVKTR